MGPPSAESGCPWRDRNLQDTVLLGRKQLATDQSGKRAHLLSMYYVSQFHSFIQTCLELLLCAWAALGSVTAVKKRMQEAGESGGARWGQARAPGAIRQSLEAHPVVPALGRAAAVIRQAEAGDAVDGQREPWGPECQRGQGR